MRHHESLQPDIGFHSLNCSRTFSSLPAAMLLKEWALTYDSHQVCQMGIASANSIILQRTRCCARRRKLGSVECGPFRWPRIANCMHVGALLQTHHHALQPDQIPNLQGFVSYQRTSREFFPFLFKQSFFANHWQTIEFSVSLLHMSVQVSP